MNILLKRINREIILLIALFFGITMFLPSGAQATSYSPTATFHQSKDNNEHTISTGKVSSFSYGSKVGSLNLSNVQEKGISINGFPSYLSNSSITIGYSYNGNAYRETEKDRWHLESDSGKAVAGIKLSGKIKMGTLIVQMSTSGRTWDTPVFEVNDLFTDKKLDRNNLYTISKEDLKQGKYIRVIVAYEMEKRVENNIFRDTYDYLYCTEVYQFYVGYNGDPVVFRDIMTRKTVHSDETVQSGFVIDKNGSSNTVNVKKGSEDWKEVQSLTSITQAGKYKIEVSTPLGKKYSYNLEVTDGIETALAKPVIYENSHKDKYIFGTPKYGSTSFGVPSLTSLTVAQAGGGSLTTGKYNGRDAYGIKGSSVILLLNLNNAEKLRGGNWQLVADNWGKKDSELIDGVHAGQVDSGALIVETSSDGRNWRNANNGRYANGLYTTDYYYHYAGMGDIPIYLPSGTDINKGLYVRVLYAYEIENRSLKADYRCVEKYEVYLCSDNLDAVTFHNLSLTGKIEESFGELDENEAEVYRMAETMLSGDYTASGFQIDISGNPTVAYKVKRDGVQMTNPRDGKITETGRYDIELTSKVGSTKSLTFFVDCMAKEEALSYYFGDPLFISGKRIYSEGSYPRYEGGHTEYSLSVVDENHLPLSGYILNLKTLDKIEIPATREAKTGSLTEAGTYEAVLATREEGFTSGDRKIFTFRFEIIAEGTAPGPVINQQKLKEYASTTVSDSYPLYYALRFPARGKGTITLAFQNWEDAYNYAYNHESGRVQKWGKDEVMTYHPSYILQETKEYDGWEITDILVDSSKNAIQSGCFNLTKIYSFTTIDPEYIKNNLFTDDIVSEQDYEKVVYDDLRELYLEYDVVLFAPGQRELLTEINKAPYIISDKPFYYLNPVKEGAVSSGSTHFEFIRDEHGYDSDKVTITDQNGKNYEIKYDKSVGAQLAAAGCPSGVVTIKEQTVYGDTATYEAIYIAKDENTAVASLTSYQKGKVQSFTLTQNDNGKRLEVDAVKSLTLADALDPYDLVIVEKDKAEATYVLDQFDELEFDEIGTYKIKIVNRLGATFSFSIDVVDPNFAAIGFAGEGTEALSDVPTQYGAHHVILPVLQREGYYLVGYEDQSGTIHSGEIEEITFRGEQILNTVWKAKQFKATFNNPDGTTNTIDVEYDSQITLPTPEVPEGKKFDGWMIDGKILESNLYTLKSENDITFVASVSDESALMRAVHGFINYAAEHMVVIVAGSTGVLILLILIGRGRTRSKRRRQ